MAYMHSKYSFVSNILLSESQLFLNGTNISAIFNESRIKNIWVNYNCNSSFHPLSFLDIMHDIIQLFQITSLKEITICDLLCSWISLVPSQYGKEFKEKYKLHIKYDHPYLTISK